MEKKQIFKVIGVALVILGAVYGENYYNWNLAHTPIEGCFEVVKNHIKNQNDIDVAKSEISFNKEERSLITIVFVTDYESIKPEQRRGLLQNILNAEVESCENKKYLNKEVTNNLTYELGIYATSRTSASHLYRARRSTKTLWAPGLK